MELLPITPVQADGRPSKRTPNPSNWKRNKAKTARYKPASLPEYPSCAHDGGSFCCKSLTMDDIKHFHSLFYKKPDREYQNNFILRYVEVRNVKRRRNRKNQTHEHTKQQLLRTTKYFVRNLQGEKVPVCMQSFLSILVVSRFRVNKITSDYHKTGFITDKRGGFKQREKYMRLKHSVRDFINSLKGVESHYCRGQTKRIYLPNGLNVKRLWKMYSNKPGCIPVKCSYFRKIFKTEYNVGFGSPRTDVCSTCLRLNELIKNEKDQNKKTTFMTQKRVHRLQYKAFYEKLRDLDENILILSYDCQKNIPLPKIPDQSTYYSRQFYFQNFTVVKGHSKLNLNPTTATSYCWIENQYSKDSNMISSCVFNTLQSTDMTNIKKLS